MKPKVVYSDRAEAAARNAARIQETTEAVASVLADLPEADNEAGIDFGLSAGKPGLQSKEHSGGVNINPNEVPDLGTARTSVYRSAERLQMNPVRGSQVESSVEKSKFHMVDGF